MNREDVELYSAEAELALLGAMFLEPDAIAEAAELVSPEAFYVRANGLLFEAIRGLWESGEAIDPVTLSNALRKADALEEAGGLEAIGALIAATPTAAHVGYHAKIVRAHATRRRLVEASQRTIRDVYDRPDLEAEELLAAAEDRVMSVATGSGITRSLVHAKALIWDVFEEIERAQDAEAGAVPGLATGLAALDHQTLGLHPGEITVVAGRPSMGKTALALQWALHATVDLGKPALVFSFEMTAEELVKRALSSLGRVDLHALRGGRKIADEEHARLARAGGALNTAALWIDDSPDSHVSAVTARARRAKSAEDVALIVIDYLQLMEGDGDGRREQVEMVSRRLKRLARSLDVPIVVLSQLSRGPESRTSKRPILSDLRETGAIEQDADNVVLLFRPEYYMTSGEVAKAINAGKDPTGLAELIIPKQRNGPTGTVTVRFDKPTTRFDDRR